MRIDIKKNEVKVYDCEECVGVIKSPVIIETWNGRQKAGVTRYFSGYDSIKAVGTEICGEVILQGEFGSVYVRDIFRPDEDAIHYSRFLEVLEKGDQCGIRLINEMEMFEGEGYTFDQFRYFAPPALFDKNDLDDDGYEDYYHTQTTIFRDDRFNYPMFMSYLEKKKKAVRIERDILPTYDSNPERKISEETGELEALFLQKTDIGSMGVEGTSTGTKLVSCYPFYEGNATIALYIIKTVPFGAFWPMEKGEQFSVNYKISCRKHEDFHEACWYSVKHVIQTTRPVAAELPVSAEELVDLRLRALDAYFVEKDSSEDVNQPAGYVLNCHPQMGEQLENIIQYGFTGQNILNAYNVIRYGNETGNKEYVRKALKTADFFADVIHMKETGLFYNLYNVDTKQVNFWWTGLLLPLAYAKGDELESLMGPLYLYRKDVIDVLVKLKGAYLRCMNEDVTALLRLYRYEKKRGNEHENWKQAILNYAEFLVGAQEPDGGWYRAYDLSGKPMLEPKKWFGGTIYEQKSSTGTSISFLVELYQLTKDERYLNAAKKAGVFVKEQIIEKVKFNGGVHDSIYAKGQLVDNESILYPMFGMLSLYEETKDLFFLEGAVKAAHFFASWVCLWKVPLPKGSTLEKYGFNSIGMGACDTCGCGYVHPFQLMGVAEAVQIGIYAQDVELFETARLYWYGCNQTVECENRPWGYAMNGLQEEGYLVSWWAVDDPMFASDTGFGNRLKGEGNKTCFPWINAVGVKAYWELVDRFGTTDFDKIFKQNFNSR